MKRYMSFNANDKMIEHTIFWDNVWNIITIVIILGTILFVKASLPGIASFLNYLR